MRSVSDVRRVLRFLHACLGNAMLDQIKGDKTWGILQGEFERGNKPAAVNRRLSVLRNLLRMARDEWQWIDTIPKIRMLKGEIERDRWLTRAEADRLIACCAPHLAAVVRYALATAGGQVAAPRKSPASNGNGWTWRAIPPGSTRPRTARRGEFR